MKASRAPWCFGMALTAVITFIAAPNRVLAADKPAATQGTAGAVERAARQYFDLIRAGKGTQAVSTYWNFNAMFAGIFGDDMKRVSADDRTKMKSLLLKFLGQVYSNPNIAKLLAQSTTGEFTAHELPDGRYTVDFDVNSGDKSIHNRLYMIQADKAWRVVDAATGQSPSLCTALHQEYLKSGMKPLEYVQAIVASLNPQK